MIEWMYNILILLFAVVWALAVKRPRVFRFLAPIMSRRRVLLAISWSLFILLASAFVVSFDYMERSHDVDDAVEAAVESYVDDVNPYVSPVVPRFKEMGHFVLFGGLADGEIEWVHGPYNYLPLDLLFYSAAYLAIGSLGSPFWFVLTNLLLASLALVLLNRVLRLDWLVYAPAAGCVALFLAFDNTSLTLLLMSAAVVAREQMKRNREVVSLLLLGLASLTKVFAAIPLACFVLFDLQRALKGRDWRMVARVGASVAACGALAIVVIVPFGVNAVLDSTVFIYSSGEEREDRPMGGTLLSELMPGSEYYSVISMASVLVAVAASMRFRDLNDRVLLVALVFLLVSVKSTLAPFSVVGLFLVLRLVGLRVKQERQSNRVEVGNVANLPSS